MREIVLDTETTGLSPADGDRVVEIGCIELANHIATPKHFHVYINPERPMPSAADYSRPGWIELPFENAETSNLAIHAGATSVEVRTGLWRTMRPVIDYDKCSGCVWICSTYCPDGAIRVRDDGYPDIDYDHCKGCLICVAQCPPHAIGSIAENVARARESEATT